MKDAFDDLNMTDIVAAVQREMPFDLGADEREAIRHAVRETLHRIEGISQRLMDETDELLPDLSRDTREGQKDAYAYMVDHLSVKRANI